MVVKNTNGCHIYFIDAEIDYVMGDINGDGVVDVSDYIGVANIILTGSVYGNGK